MAELGEGEDPSAATRKLQAQAEELVEDHKRLVLKQLEDLYQLNQRQQELVSLKAQLERAQERIDEIRREAPELGNLPLLEGETV